MHTELLSALTPLFCNKMDKSSYRRLPPRTAAYRRLPPPTAAYRRILSTPKMEGI